MSIAIDLSGWVVLITGGARGVGRGIASRFREAGAFVEICGRSESAEIAPVDDPGITYSSLDVRDADAVEGWIADVVARRGRIDVVVNNAGGSPFGAFEEGSARYMRALTDLNFLSAAFVARAAHPHLAASPQGSVINITSISARRPSPGTAVYGAAKAALESLTESLAVEWAPRVRVNAVSCGLVATEAAASHYGDAEQFAKVAATIPRGQLADPLEIGWACVMLAAPHSSHITGAVVDVDGGGEWPAFLSHTPHAGFVTRSQGATS
ncbi:SDR family oxidoreductase [Salinibacterium sp. ZJ70]|uniref:SDR family oxidoreductase n=1 Tax=Salinibacterium sp. ZJ70 TaxID=2708084 RepID=UPI001420ABE9|nr:SDR family oxidoreductase [Salinibacterium sp. ZJ70]